mmetsp:Transcript_8825/g.27122  ORF Transcript_8825/g.27122 Transcript_8825/m.27122 type:complete len:198 (-) Transcript_8825:122-715(-)
MVDDGSAALPPDNGAVPGDNAVPDAPAAGALPRALAQRPRKWVLVLAVVGVVAVLCGAGVYAVRVGVGPPPPPEPVTCPKSKKWWDRAAGAVVGFVVAKTPRWISVHIPGAVRTIQVTPATGVASVATGVGGWLVNTVGKVGGEIGGNIGKVADNIKDIGREFLVRVDTFNFILAFFGSCFVGLAVYDRTVAEPAAA